MEFSYYFPIVAGAVLALLGVTILAIAPHIILRFDRGTGSWIAESKSCDPQEAAKFWYRLFGGLLLGVGVLLVAVTLATSPTPAQRRQLVSDVLNVEPSKIVCVDLLPRTYGSLVETPVRVKDDAELTRIARALRRAKRFHPNHPGAAWLVDVQMTTTKGDVTFVVRHTDQPENGTFFTIYSRKSDGWVVGDFRCDELAEILESLVTKQDST